jgi:hypothetical protein
MFHLLGYYESVDQAGAAANIAAMNDPTISTSGDTVRVPKELAYLQGAACLSAATTLTSAYVKSPSLRTRNNFPIGPLVNADDFPSIPPISWLADNPIPLTGGEQMTFETTSDNTGAVAIQGLVWLSDGSLQRRGGEIFSFSFSTGITLAAGSWVNGAITLDQQLPNGMYSIVGLRAVGTNLQAARIVLPGGAWRPGVPAQSTAFEDGNQYFRNGMLGDWGTFDSDNLPSIDALGHTDTSQEYIMDVVKIG